MQSCRTKSEQLMRLIGMPLKPITPVVLESLGANGLNTQSQNASLGPEWLTSAENVVYDLQGRMGPRKGSQQVSKTVASPVSSLGCYVLADRTRVCYGGVGATIVKIDKTVTPYSLTTQSFGGTPKTITAANWQWINFNDEFWGVQKGHMPINLTTTTWSDLDDMGAYVASSGITTFDPACALGEFGRMWYGGSTEDLGILYYSDNLIGEKLNGGAAGTLDLKTVWGNDEIVGLASIENKIVIFGKQNIAIYSGAGNPASMVLDDLITGVGLAGRDNIISMGADILFMSYEGLKSLSRVTASDGKSPIDDVSLSVRSDLTTILKSATVDNIKSVYNQGTGEVIIFMPDNDVTYCFNFAMGIKQLPKVTTWKFAKAPKCGVYDIDGTFFFGLSDSVASYINYHDITITDSTSTYANVTVCEAASNTWETSTCWTYANVDYNWTFQSSWMNLGDPNFAKIVKRGLVTITGGQGAASTITIAKDYEEDTTYQKTFNLVSDSITYLWGAAISLYGSSKYAPAAGPKEYKLPLARTGKVIRMKLVTEVKGHYSSLVNTTLLVKQGKIR